MHWLALDTSTEVMSVAVVRDLGGPQERFWTHEGAGGAQASAALIPTVLELLRQAELELRSLQAVCFGQGPGSFTGLRTACAVAQGLAFGAGLPVLPVPSLLVVAEAARLQPAPAVPRPASAAFHCVAVLDARMDELYAQPWHWDGQRWHTSCAPVLLAPALLGAWLERLPPHPEATDCVMAGTGLEQHASALQSVQPAWPRITVLPGAMAMLRLAPALWAQGAAVPAHEALPLYVRDKVALTEAERALARQARANAEAGHG